MTLLFKPSTSKVSETPECQTETHANEDVAVREAAKIAQESKNLSILGLFGKKMWKRTVCGTSVQMWQQLLGGNVAMYYIVYVFRMAGLVSRPKPRNLPHSTTHSNLSPPSRPET